MDGKPGILIIDDEEIVLDSCTQILRKSPYRLATAPNGAAGLDLLVAPHAAWLAWGPNIVYQIGGLWAVSRVAKR